MPKTVGQDGTPLRGKGRHPFLYFKQRKKGEEGETE